MSTMSRAPKLALLKSLVVLLPLVGGSFGCAELHGGGALHDAIAATPQPAPQVVSKPKTWDGVAFTTAEAALVLSYVNGATLAELDSEAGLDVRAARSIVEAQPIADLGELAGLYFVGKVTLEKLKSVAFEQTLAAVVSGSRRS